MKGYIQVYTGDGKGKTTAALGLALRAAGAGLRVYVAQFVEGMRYSEHEALAALGDQIEVHLFGRDCFIEKEPAPEDIEAARGGLAEVARVIARLQDANRRYADQVRKYQELRGAVPAADDAST